MGIVGEDMGGEIRSATSAGMQIDENAAEQEEGLLPGIPDEITLAHITPKLPWRTFHILSSVSPSWQQAIQGHQVYVARARSNSTETLAVVSLAEGNSRSRTVALYSLRDQRFWQIPPIPQVEQFPQNSECVALDGKLYVLGGMKKAYPSSDPRTDLGTDEVYVLDLAGQRQWTQCSSMRQARHHFGCGVLNGKIYVFGGTSLYQPVSGSEVYDPRADVWAPISPMPSLRFRHLVTTVGDELVVQGGKFYEPDWLKWKRTHGVPGAPDFEMGQAVLDIDGIQLEHPLADHIQESFSLEIYHPGKDEWRVAHLPERQHMDIVSVAEGKLCAISWGDSYVRDVSCKSSWAKLHSFLCDEILRTDYDLCEPFGTVVVDGELLGLACWLDEEELRYESCLVRSRGFSSGSADVVWQRAQWFCPIEKPFVVKYIVCTIQL